MRDLAKYAIEVTGGKPEVVYNPRNEGGISRLCADITVAEERLSYTPKVSLVEGLTRTLAHDISPNKVFNGA